MIEDAGHDAYVWCTHDRYGPVVISFEAVFGDGVLDVYVDDAVSDADAAEVFRLLLRTLDLEGIRRRRHAN